MSESGSQVTVGTQGEFKVPSAALGRRKKPEGTLKAREQGEEHPGVTECEHHVETIEAKEIAAPDNVTTLEQTQQKQHVQKLKDATPPSPAVPYNEPQWSGVPVEPHTLTVIKNGTVVQEVNVSTKPFHVFGRLPTCDVSLEHPSISRHHGILQYRPHSGETPPHAGDHHTLFSTNPQESGFYIYDLGSTHGTFLNKTKLQPRCYYRMRVGQMVRFGGSSRLFVLEGGGGQEGVEQEAEAERQDILRQREQFEKRKAEQLGEEERAAKESAEMGATWGMVVDDIPLHAQESEEIEIDPVREAYYKEDPKKALKKFFDREGLELEYETEEDGPLHSRTYTVTVRLPIDLATGEPLYAEASVRGRKKEAVVQCALNACRMLDAQGMLRNPIQARKRKLKNWEENDYYDSDDDTFLDRTGSVEKKRKQRMKKAGKVEEVSESYKSLQAKLTEVQTEIHSLENRLARANEVESTEATVDSLDAYMKSVGDQLDETKKLEIKHSLHDLRKEEERVRKLIEITKPVDLPALSSSSRKSPQHQYSQETPVVTSQEKKEKEPKKQKCRQRSSKKLESQLNPSNVNVGCSNVCESNLHMKDTTPNEEYAVVSTSDREKVSATPSSPKKAKTMQWEDDDNYSSWIPPSNQSGDGRTHLNEKFGY